MNTQPRITAHAGLLVNQALLKLVKQYGEASYGLLFDQFGELELHANYAHARFSKKLIYLCSTGQLQRLGWGKKAIYKLGHLAFMPQPGTARAARCGSGAPVVAAPCGSGALAAIEPDSHRPEGGPPTSKATPINYDVMRAPTLQIALTPALRPGALDYQRYASHGSRC
jgi:hypothetical protein